MTQPDGLFPSGAFNLDSLAELAARPQSEWEAMIRGQSSNGFEMFLSALFGPLPADLREGIEFTRALVTAIIRQILNLPGQIWDSVEDALAALAGWVADIPIIGDILTIINDTFSAIFGGIDFTGTLPTPAEVWQTVINTLMLPLNLLLGPNSPLNALNIFGRLQLPQFGGGVPLSALTPTVPNELEPFSATSVPTSDGWSWDAAAGAAKVVADGSTKTLFLSGAAIKVDADQPLQYQIPVRYTGVTSGAGQTIQLALDTFTSDDGSGTATRVVVGSITSPAGTLSVPTVLGALNWDVPDGVGSVRPVLVVDELVTAGSVFWLNTPVLKKKLAGPLSDGLPKAIQDRIDDFQGLLSDLLSNPAGVIGTITQGMVSGLPDLNTLTNQIRDILAGLVVTPIDSTVQAIKDWFTGVVGKTQNLTSGGNLPQNAVSGLPGALNEFSTNFTELLNGVTTGTWNPASELNDLISSLFGTKTKTNQIVEDVETAWTGDTPSGTPTPVYDTITEIKNAVSGIYTMEVKTTSGTWTNPGGIVEFWVLCIGSGDGGSSGAGTASNLFAYGGDSGNTTTSTVGAAGGNYLAQQVNPADLTATVDYTVPAGGAGGLGPTSSPGTPGAAATFGSYASSETVQSASIASILGYYNADASAPGYGGPGGWKTSGGNDFAGKSGKSTPLATGGSFGSPGANGGAGGDASLTGQSRCGGGGGGGGGGNASGKGGNGGAGGFPGGAGGGGGGGLAGSGGGGNGGNGANGAIVLIYR